MGKTWNTLKHSGDARLDTTPDENLKPAESNIPSTTNTLQRQWRISLHREESRKPRKSSSMRKGGWKSEDDELDEGWKSTLKKESKPTKRKSYGGSSNLHRKPSASEENLGDCGRKSSRTMRASLTPSSSLGDDFYINSKGANVRKCATLKPTKSSRVDRVESIKGMILSRTGKSPARTSRRDELSLTTKKWTHNNNNNNNNSSNSTAQRQTKTSPLFRSCSTSTLPSYVAGDDPASDLDFSPKHRRYFITTSAASKDGYQFSPSSNNNELQTNNSGGSGTSSSHNNNSRSKMLMLGASAYYSNSPCSSIGGSSSSPCSAKKAISLDNIASLVGSDVTSPLSKKFGFPHHFIPNKLAVLPEESMHYQHNKLLVSSLSSDSVHLAVANSTLLAPTKHQNTKKNKDNSSETGMTNNNTQDNCVTKPTKLTSSSSGSRLASLFQRVRRHSSSVSYRSRSNSPVTTNSVTRATRQNTATVTRSVSAHARCSRIDVKSASSSCEMLDSLRSSYCYQSEESCKNGSSDKMNVPNNSVTETSSVVVPCVTTSENNKEVRNNDNEGEQGSPPCQFGESNCQSQQNLSQGKSVVSSRTASTVTVAGSTYISSNESGYDSDSTKNADETNPHLNLNEQGSGTSSSGSSKNSGEDVLSLSGESGGSQTQIPAVVISAEEGTETEDGMNHQGSVMPLRTFPWDFEHTPQVQLNKSKTAIVRRKSDLANAIIARYAATTSSSSIHPDGRDNSNVNTESCSLQRTLASLDRENNGRHLGNHQNSENIYEPLSPYCMPMCSSVPSYATTQRSRTRTRIRCLESREIFRLCTSTSVPRTFLESPTRNSYAGDELISCSEPTTPISELNKTFVPPQQPPQVHTNRRFFLFNVVKGADDPLGFFIRVNCDSGTFQHLIGDITKGSAVQR